ncbi:MAG: OB-fold domain-containing protein [bacterium]|nr:OB-fold domain-containing protein [bacterium]
MERTITDIVAPDSIASDPVAIADGLFTPGAQTCLIGGRDRDTGRIVFPCPANDPRFEAITLPRQGRIWSWTIQRFRPKTPPYIGPEAFEPFAIGYVELPDAVIVETRLTGMAFDAIRIGMAVETVTIPVGTNATGRIVIGYAFAPVQEDATHV